MKLFVDSGEAESIDEAKEIFARYGVRVNLGASVASSQALQAIALTVINTAARSFEGNVAVVCDEDIELKVHGFENTKLSDFNAWVGVKPASDISKTWPEIFIGITEERSGTGRLNPWASGWIFGLGGKVEVEGKFFAPACVAAGALAVSEAFSILRKDNPYAGRRDIKFSLWSMATDLVQPPADIEVDMGDGLWIVGLGHLGQAFCWTLAMMFQRSPVKLVLQDVDIVTDSTLTTSVLSIASDLKRMKTRVVSEWMEQRGYKTHLVERRFDSETRVAADEPHTALFGVDNPAARRVCEAAGFRVILDAGLGSGYNDFRALRVRGFPGVSAAASIWSEDAAQKPSPLAAAYQQLLSEGVDPCGVTTLATRSVGAPFVGCYAAALVIAELLRRRAGEQGRNVIDVNLRAPDRADVA